MPHRVSSSLSCRNCPQTGLTNQTQAQAQSQAQAGQTDRKSSTGSVYGFGFSSHGGRNLHFIAFTRAACLMPAPKATQGDHRNAQWSPGEATAQVLGSIPYQVQFPVPVPVPILISAPASFKLYMLCLQTFQRSTALSKVSVPVLVPVPILVPVPVHLNLTVLCLQTFQQSTVLTKFKFQF